MDWIESLSKDRYKVGVDVLVQNTAVTQYSSLWMDLLNGTLADDSCNALGTLSEFYFPYTTSNQFLKQKLVF